MVKYRLRSILAVGVTLAMALGLVTSPSQAASQLIVSLGVNVDGIYLPNDGTIWTHARIYAYLPMNLYDAQGYINNGARVEIYCNGQDFLIDDSLFHNWLYVATGSTLADYYLHGAGIMLHNVNRLLATEYGVSLQAVIGAPFRTAPTSDTYLGFNEDSQWPEVTDEVYCDVTWIDGDGGTLSARTNVVSGDF